MKRINLLPEHLMQAQARQRRQLLHATLLAAAAIAVTGWLTVAVVQVRALDQQIANAERELEPLRQEDQQIQKLHQQLHELTGQLAIIDTLREPLPTSAILALLSQLAPQEAVLRSVVIDMPSPTLPTPPAKGASASARRAAKPATPKPIQIQLDGLASQDVAIARLVSVLTEAGVFQNVRLADSRETVINGRACHQFRVSMDVALTHGPVAMLGNGLAKR